MFGRIIPPWRQNTVNTFGWTWRQDKRKIWITYDRQSNNHQTHYRLHYDIRSISYFHKTKRNCIDIRGDRNGTQRNTTQGNALHTNRNIFRLPKYPHIHTCMSTNEYIHTCMQQVWITCEFIQSNHSRMRVGLNWFRHVTDMLYAKLCKYFCIIYICMYISLFTIL